MILSLVILIDCCFVLFALFANIMPSSHLFLHVITFHIEEPFLLQSVSLSFTDSLWSHSTLLKSSIKQADDKLKFFGFQDFSSKSHFQGKNIENFSNYLIRNNRLKWMEKGKLLWRKDSNSLKPQ